MDQYTLKTIENLRQNGYSAAAAHIADVASRTAAEKLKSAVMDEFFNIDCDDSDLAYLADADCRSQKETLYSARQRLLEEESQFNTFCEFLIRNDDLLFAAQKYIRELLAIENVRRFYQW